MNPPQQPQAKLPKVICRLCKRLFDEPGASLQWHANSFGRAVCPDCQKLCRVCRRPH